MMDQQEPDFCAECGATLTGQKCDQDHLTD